jgi:hypothetical protein
LLLAPVTPASVTLAQIDVGYSRLLVHTYYQGNSYLSNVNITCGGWGSLLPNPSVAALQQPPPCLTAEVHTWVELTASLSRLQRDTDNVVVKVSVFTLVWGKGSVSGANSSRHHS